MRKFCLRSGSLLMLIAVTFGAMGSHILENQIGIEPKYLDTFSTGLRYHFIHALALLMLGTLLYERKTNMMTQAAYFFLVGTILFSGSLYLLSLQEVVPLPLGWLGLLTPFGGILLMAGWLFMFLSTFQENRWLYQQDQDE